MDHNMKWVKKVHRIQNNSEWVRELNVSQTKSLVEENPADQGSSIKVFAL